MSLGAQLIFSSVLSALDPSASRLLVNKQPSNSSDLSQPLYYPIDETLILAAHFARISDYPSFSLYEGSGAAVEALIGALARVGYVAAPTTDMDTILLLGHTVNADTGLADPPYKTATVQKQMATQNNGAYLIAFRGYPLQEWLDDLSKKGISIIEPLPPSAYIVQATPEVAATLVATTNYTRGVFPMLAAMKAEPVTEAQSLGDPTFMPVSIEAYESTKEQSLEPFLASVAREGSLTIISQEGPRVQYAAALTTVDIDTLSQFDALTVIAPIADVEPSSERQAMLVTFPHFGAGANIFLPAAVEFGGYMNYMSASQYGKNITNFGNTKIATLDTGFDDGAATVHPDFTCPAGKPNCTAGQSFVITALGATSFNQTLDANVDDISHGTVTASVIGGYPPSGTRLDSGSYLYGLGLAPTASIAVDKFFSRTGNYSSTNTDALSRLTNALTTLAVFGPNVVNHSWNAGGNGASPPPPQVDYTKYCAYDTLSKQLDIHTRTRRVLHVVAAGNGLTDAPCPYVRSPGTAKNVITVGATENYTLGSWGKQFGSDGYVATCPSDYFPMTQDGRNVAAFSGQKNLARLACLNRTSSRLDYG